MRIVLNGHNTLGSNINRSAMTNNNGEFIIEGDDDGRVTPSDDCIVYNDDTTDSNDGGMATRQNNEGTDSDSVQIVTAGHNVNNNDEYIVESDNSELSNDNCVNFNGETKTAF